MVKAKAYRAEEIHDFIDPRWVRPIRAALEARRLSDNAPAYISDKQAKFLKGYMGDTSDNAAIAVIRQIGERSQREAARG